jgi:hypothetical protein
VLCAVCCVHELHRRQGKGQTTCFCIHSCPTCVCYCTPINCTPINCTLMTHAHTHTHSHLYGLRSRVLLFAHARTHTHTHAHTHTHTPSQGNFIHCLGEDGVLYCFAIATGQVCFPSPHTCAVLRNMCLRSRICASCMGGEGSTTWLWKHCATHTIYSIQLEHVLKLHERDPIGTALHPHRNLLASYASEGVLRLWRP